MNKKLESRISQLVFGDLSEREGAALRAEIARDPEAVRALAQYEALRNELRGLPIPPDQYSKDRLRTAILAGGLGTRKRSPGGWLWAPVAVAGAVLAGLFLTETRPPSKEARFVVREHSVEVATNDVPTPILRFPDEGPDARNGLRFSAPSVELSPEPPSSKPNSAASARSKPTAPRAASNPASQAVAAEPGAARVEMRALAADAGFAPAAAPAVPSIPQSTAVILVIGAEQDDQSGATIANEVHNPTNVVIGV